MRYEHNDKTIWLVHPKHLDSMTSKYLAQVVGEQNRELGGEVKCANGDRLLMYECPHGYEDVRSARTSMYDFNLRFEVFKIDPGHELAVPFKLQDKSVCRAARLGKAFKSCVGRVRSADRSRR